MRTWFWTLLVAVVAVALAVLLRHHPGNVLLLLWPWRIELSLPLAVLLGIAAFGALYGVLRLFVWLVAIPERVRAWRGRRTQARDYELLERGWLQLLEGRFLQARKDLLKLLEQTRGRQRRVLAALSAARATHALGEFMQRDHLLELAREHADSHPELREATAMVTADMLLDQGRAQDALAVLAPLQNSGPRHLRIMQLLLRAERILNHHDRAFTLVRELLRYHMLDRAEANHLLGVAGAARLRAATADDNWRFIWKEFKAEERLLPDIALAGAAAFEAAGEPEEAARILEAAIAVNFDPKLMAVYAYCDAEQIPRRLAKAETWLHQRPTDSELLVMLGVLCLNGQLWGQAERYLLRSVTGGSEPKAHALLGSLYDHLERPLEATRHWRLAIAASMTLPALATHAALPAAETQHDPYRMDAEGGYMADDASVAGALSQQNKVAPTGLAAGYGVGSEAHLYGVRPEVAVPPRSAVNIEEYFDSAPIPVDSFDDSAPTHDPPHQPAAKPADEPPPEPDDAPERSSPKRNG
jgi:HemY protein